MDMVADEGELNLRADRYDVCDDVWFGAELLFGDCEFLPQGLIQILKNEFDFYEWEQLDNGFSISRLVTSWATPESQVDRFIEKVKENTSNN